MKQGGRILRALLALGALFLPLAAGAVEAQQYDLVIANGRVIDPESGLDAVRHVGIVKDRIAAVSDKPLDGREVVDARGLVVAPGFIDLHAHGQNLPSQTYQVRDGVTTALELEGGIHPLPPALAAREGKALINYGYSAGYGDIRVLVKDKDLKRAFHEEATAEERSRIFALVEEDIANGAMGIGLPLDYLSRGVNEAELEGLFRIAARHKMPLFIHIRMSDDASDPSGFAELIEMSRRTGAPFHMVHIVSTGLQRVPLYLEMMEKARADGLDVTTELYPYTAGSTGINSGIFDHDWQRKFGVSYDAIEWPPTGERFRDKAMWDEYRAKYPDGTIIIHAMKEEWVEQALRHPGVMIASDGMPIERLDERAHPRGMGTFSRVLGHYVREKKVISLADAISRMTLLPAKRLESFTPAMKRKGRISVGADADVTIFDPERVIDKATFAEPNQFAEGIAHVLVAGQFVVRDGDLVPDSFPGRPISTRSQ